MTTENLYSSSMKEAVIQALTERYGEIAARFIAFHLHESMGGIRFIRALDRAPNRFSPYEILVGVRDFLTHAPNHLAVAALIAGYPVHQFFGPQIFSNDEDADNHLQSRANKGPIDMQDAIALALTERYGAARAWDIGFHFHEWSREARFVIGLDHSPKRFSLKTIQRGVIHFLVHAPNHVAEAAWLAGFPLKKIFYKVPKTRRQQEIEKDSHRRKNRQYGASNRYP